MERINVHFYEKYVYQFLNTRKVYGQQKCKSGYKLYESLIWFLLLLLLLFGISM